MISRRQLLLALGGAGAAAAAPRPNIVVFLSDDMGWEQIGFNGGKEAATPNIDRIASEGAKLTQFYVQPVCTPSRSCLLTGRYAWKTGTEIRPGAASRQGMLGDERTIAEALREAGYATWMCGKWHLGEWQTRHLPLARGFEHHYGHYGALVDSFTHTREGVLDWHRNGKPAVEKGYSTFLLAQEAARLIREHDGKRPFFLYLPFNAVHGPHLAPEEFVNKYSHLGRNAAQRAQLECMDIAIGRVLEALRAKGLDRRTLVIFTNDNGGSHGAPNGPYRGGKSAYHEGGIRVPCAVRWPGRIRPGTATDEMLHVTDLFPSLCRLAGAVAEKKLPLDGKDAWDVIANRAATPRDEIVHSLQVIRQGDWKLIEEGAAYYNWPEQPLQLYDIRQDPYEKNNLAAAKPGVVARLRERLKFHRRLAREPEPQERIPDHPPAVYGEAENREHGAWVREQLKSLSGDHRRRRKKKG